MKRTLLVIDDEQSIRMLLENFLGKEFVQMISVEIFVRIIYFIIHHHF
jgi:DNA-binding NtrC family response regulator